MDSIMKRPNILLIITDQQYAGAMSCAENAELSTPAMDTLAETGVRFSQAYCTYPLCIPARESILTGRMPFELGYRKWGDAMDERFRSDQMGFVFRDAGYECVYAGKLHAPGTDPTEHGFRTLCEQNDYKVADACMDYLRGDHAEPFCMVASFDNPHNICEWARHQKLPWGNIPDARTEDCPSLPTNFGIPAYEPEVIRLIQSREPSCYPVVGNTPDQWRQYRNAYYRLVEKVDREIGKVLEALRTAGLRENTIIVFTSDHGDGHGAHQWNQKSMLYEECIRIPFIVCPPGDMIRAGMVEREHLVSNGLDLLPTLCDYAGVDAPADLSGHSLRPLMEGRATTGIPTNNPGAGGTAPSSEPTSLEGRVSPRPVQSQGVSSDSTGWRDELIIEAWPHQGDPGKTLGRAVITERYKYIIYGWGRYREQLFDRQRDPGEMSNLAVCSQYAAILSEHRERLRAWCERTGDEFGAVGI